MVVNATFNILKRADKYSVVASGEYRNGERFAFVSPCHFSIEDDFFRVFIENENTHVPKIIFGFFNSKNEVIFTFCNCYKFQEIEVSNLHWIRLYR